MRKLLTTMFLSAFAITAIAATTEERINSDGSRSIVKQVLDIAFGPNKSTIAFALFILGAVLCAAAVWLASQDRGSKSGSASHISVGIPQKFSAKAFFGFPSLVLIIGALISVAGALLFVSERFYSATI